MIWKALGFLNYMTVFQLLLLIRASPPCCIHFAENVETVLQIPSRPAARTLLLCMERAARFLQRLSLSLSPGAMPGAILTINTAGQFLALIQRS